MNETMPGAEPFAFPGSEVGCLLLRGFAATPQELRRLGPFLANQGYHVRAPLLAGHGTAVQDVNATT